MHTEQAVSKKNNNKCQLKLMDKRLVVQLVAGCSGHRTKSLIRRRGLCILNKAKGSDVTATLSKSLWDSRSFSMA